MKYLCLLLLSIVGFNAYSQIAVLNADSARLGNPAGTGIVALHGTTVIKNITAGNTTDSVLVRDSEGNVKFVKRSSFGTLNIPFSNGDYLPGANFNGRFLFNTALQKLRIYDAVTGTWKDALLVDLNRYYTKAQVDSLMARQPLLTLTTAGTGGVATFNQSTGALNIPNYASALPVDFFVNGKINPNYLPGGTLAKLNAPVVSKGIFTSTTAPLTWPAITNALSYVVQRSTDNSTWANSGTPSANSFTDTGLTASTLYYWRVKAVGSGYADSDYSLVVSGTTEAVSGGEPVAITSFSSLAPATLAGNVITGSNGGDDRIISSNYYTSVEIRFDESWSDGSTFYKNSPVIGLHSTNEPLQPQHLDYTLALASNGKLIYTVKRQGESTTFNDTGVYLPLNSNSQMRIEMISGNVVFSYTTNNGTSWIVLATVPDITPAQRYATVFIWDAQVARDVKGKLAPSDLLSGYAYTNLSLGQSDVSITRIGNTETWRLYNDGIGKSQPGQKFVKGSAFGIQKRVNTHQQILSITYAQGSNGNYLALSMVFDENGNLKITANHDTDVIDDTPTIQPSTGQYSIFEDISTGTSPLSTRIIKHSILDVDKTTVIYTKNYTIHNTSENNSVLDFVIINQNSVMNYPQSKNTVAY